MSAPREIDRADVLNELVHRWAETVGDFAGEPGVAWVLDQLTELDILAYRKPPLCGVSEGMTGIDCGLPKGHVMPDGSLRTVHEGTTTPEQTERVGYEMSVRWPVNGTTLPIEPTNPRDLCTVDECEAAPRCSSGATVWHAPTPACKAVS